MSKIFEALQMTSRSKQEEQAPVPLVLLEEEKLELGPELIVYHEPESAIADCFRFIRSKITRPSNGNAPRTILVTSVLTGEGKTFASCNLAVAISQGLDEHVLLIDADLRRPRVHEVFNMQPADAALSTCLSGITHLAAAIRKTPIEKLSVLLAGKETEAPAELLSSERMRLLLEDVRRRYADGFVIIDSPPLLLAPETTVMANEVDAAIIVVRHGKTPRDALKAGIEKIGKEKLLGVVFNGCNDRVNTYTRYGYYGYGYKKQS